MMKFLVLEFFGLFVGVFKKPVEPNPAPAQAKILLCSFPFWRLFSVFSIRLCPRFVWCLVNCYYFSWDWPILLVYGSIDSLWPKDLNGGRIFFGTDPSPHGEGLKSFFLCISYLLSRVPEKKAGKSGKPEKTRKTGKPKKPEKNRKRAGNDGKKDLKTSKHLELKIRSS